MSLRRVVTALAIALVAIMPLLSIRIAAQPTTKAAGTTTATQTGPQILGSASCSGRACHGGGQPEDKPIQQNEFSTWVEHDRHARAYEALLSDRGQRIARNIDPEMKAHEDVRCLSCHVTPQLAAASVPREQQQLRGEGVGCEACHGGARDWLVPHTTAAWKNNADRSALLKQHGMTDVNNLVVQAQTCVGCHVGAPADPAKGIPARDLNHDLMAAGHPRLDFELTAYRANMPPHWNVGKYKNDPGHEAKSWAVGQAVAAHASLALLGYRATEAEKQSAPWPEFAETDCFTCHADFSNKSWRRSESYYKGRIPGTLPYSRWYSALLPALGPVAGGTEKLAVEAMAALEKAMSRPSSDPAQIAADVTGDLPKLEALVKAAAGATYDAKAVAALLAAVKSPRGDLAAMRWEQLEQLALALGALQPKMSPELPAVYRLLAFPSGFESPAFNFDANGKDFANRHAELVKALEAELKAK